MLEALFQATGSNSKFFPNSGPGPKILVQGDKNLGYFGVVNPEDLFSQIDLDVKIPSQGTTVVPTGEQVFNWQKFIYNEKVLFIASIPTKSAVSWNTLYADGLIYGIDDVGSYPAISPVNQFRLITKEVPVEKRTYGFKVRTLTGHKNEPYLSTTAGSLAPNEFDDLLKLIPQALTTTGLVKYMLSVPHVTKNTFQTTTSQYASRNYDSSFNPVITTTAKATASQYWRPVLELIPAGSYIFNPINLYSLFDADKPPYGLSGDFVDVVKGPISVYGTQDALTQPLLNTYTIT